MPLTPSHTHAMLSHRTSALPAPPPPLQNTSRRLCPADKRGKRAFAPVMRRRLAKLGITKDDPDALTPEEVSAFARLDLDPASITWKRVMDVNDRHARGCVCVFMCVSVWLCVCVCVFVCLSVSVLMCVCARACLCVRCVLGRRGCDGRAAGRGALDGWLLLLVPLKRRTDCG